MNLPVGVITEEGVRWYGTAPLDVSIGAEIYLVKPQPLAMQHRLAAAWVHGFENRFEPPGSGLKPLVSFVHSPHWSDEYWKPLYEGPEMLDIAGAKLVEVEVSKDQRVLWVNVDGICKFRVCQIESIQVNGPGGSLSY